MLDPDATVGFLRKIVERVRVWTIPGKTRDELMAEAVSDLLEHAIPAIGPAKDLERFLLRSVKNFYRDAARGAGRRLEIPMDEADIERAARPYHETGHRRRGSRRPEG